MKKESGKRFDQCCTTLRKYLSVILVGLFLFDLGGYYLWFSMSQKSIQKEIKHQIRAGLNEEDLTVFNLSGQNEKLFLWIKPGKEFRYQGEMYDVVKTREEEQGIVYYCICDVKEKQLIAKYNFTHNPGKDTARQIRRLLSLQYLPESIPLIYTVELSDYFYPSLTLAYLFTFPDILSPPPKSAFLSC